MSEKITPNYMCRSHPTDGWHEVGCSHQNWTKEQLQSALNTQIAQRNARPRPEVDIEEVKRRIVGELNWAMDRAHCEVNPSERKAHYEGRIVMCEKFLSLLTSKAEEKGNEG